MKVLGIDVGGSGIKGALVDIESGELVGERQRIVTPKDFGTNGVTGTIVDLVSRFDFDGPVGVGFPSILDRGIVLSPPTAHEVGGWMGVALDGRLSEACRRPVSVLNDADAAGMAEVRFGAGRGIKGMVMTVTLGTGVGGGLFMNGKLVPNLEIGKIYLEGHDQVVEQYMAGRIRKEESLSWEEYGARIREFCLHVEKVFSPQLIVLGGGVSKNFGKFMDEGLLNHSRVVPARLLNEAGIVGAAVWASEAAA